MKKPLKNLDGYLHIDSDALTFAAHMRSPIWVFDLDHKRILWANEDALRIWAADTLEELQARDMGKDMSQSVATRLDQYRQDFTSSKAVFSETWSLYPKGVPVTLRVIHSGIILADGRMALLCEGLEDLKADPETLRCAEALLHTSVMITLFTYDGGALYRNPAARTVVADIAETFSEHFVDPRAWQGLMESLKENGQARSVALVYTNTGKRWHEISARRCRDAVTGEWAWLISEVDVSELKRAEAQALHLASHDMLTELPNRKYVMEHFQYLLEQAKATGQRAALMFMDLDRFKYINDSIGHSAGDALLVEMARRLKAGLRSSDVVARLSGDEFLVLTVAENISAYADTLAARLLKKISMPCTIMGHKLSTTPSIGVAFFPQDGEDLLTLMKHADMAMYHAKEGGGNSVAYYKPEFGRMVHSKITERNELKAALERKEFVIYLQQRIDVKTGGIIGAEALARWIHPEQGMVAPDMFIPACEENGLIAELGLQVFEQAAVQQRKYEQEGIPLAISVNLSPYQLRDPSLFKEIEAVLERTGANPSYLDFEITESALLDDSSQAILLLKQFRDRGFNLYIDDFGTGYSNFSYLQRYPLSGLKIDRSFINVPSDQRMLAAMIIMMSKAMGFRVIAEGVETEEQLTWLQENDCDELQGFFIARPVPVDAFEVDIRNSIAQARSARLLRS